jgi:hypothetical protein
MGRKRRAHMTPTFVMSTSIVGKILSAERKEKALLKRFACRNLSESLRRFIQSDEEVGFLGFGRWHSPWAALDLKVVGPQRTFRAA